MHHQTWWVSMMLHRIESWEWDRGNEIRACCCHWVYFVLQIKDKLICPDEVVLAGIHGCLQQAGSGCGIRSAAKEPHPHDHRKHYFMDAGLKNLEHDFNALPPKPSVGEPHSLLGELHCLELHCTTGTEPVCGRNQRSVGYTSKSRRYFQPSNLLYPTTTCVAASTELHPRTTKLVQCNGEPSHTRHISWTELRNCVHHKHLWFQVRWRLELHRSQQQTHQWLLLYVLYYSTLVECRVLWGLQVWVAIAVASFTIETGGQNSHVM